MWRDVKESVFNSSLLIVFSCAFRGLRPYTGPRSNISAFSTSGIDGKIVVWNLLEAGITNLRL